MYYIHLSIFFFLQKIVIHNLTLSWCPRICIINTYHFIYCYILWLYCVQSFLMYIGWSTYFLIKLSLWQRLLIAYQYIIFSFMSRIPSFNHSDKRLYFSIFLISRSEQLTKCWLVRNK